jgi:type IV pilus assembly protein PilV
MGKRQLKSKAASGGFSLIEVLIAAFVIAIGVLGVSSAQLISIKNNQSAYYRSQANFLAMDILDRMRANPDGVQNGFYNNIDTATTTPSAALPNCATNANGCSSQEIATADARQWAANFSRDGVVGLIPGSTGTVVTQVAGAITTVTVTVTWSENNWNDDPDGDGDAADGGFGDSTGRVSLSVRM